MAFTKMPTLLYLIISLFLITAANALANPEPTQVSPARHPAEQQLVARAADSSSSSSSSSSYDSPTVHSTQENVEAPLSKRDGSAQAPGSSCSEEGQWNCMTDTWQRCGSGFWTGSMDVAPGTYCHPVGLSMSFHVDISNGDSGDGSGSSSDNGQWDGPYLAGADGWRSKRVRGTAMGVAAAVVLVVLG